MSSCPVCFSDTSPEANFCMACGASLVGENDNTTELSAPILSDQSGRAVIVVERGPNAGSSYVVGDDEMSVGRLSDSAILLDDVSVSRRHVVIRPSGDGHEVEDLGSLNGTYVNGSRSERSLLSDGDQIRVGRYKLRYLRSDR